MNKKAFRLLIAFGSVFISNFAIADDITYYVNQPIGIGGAIGTITTDGVIGTVISSDILNWNLQLTFGDSTTFDISNLNSPLYGDTSINMTATATSLFYNFSGPVNQVYFEDTTGGVGNGDYYCLQSTITGACEQGESVSDNAGGYGNLDMPLSGNLVIASVDVPEPSPLILLAAGFIGLSISLRKKRLA